MTEIIKGGNLPLSGEPMRVAVVRRDGGPGSPAVDAAALLVGAGGKVRGRGDLVFYNQPEHAASAVRLLGDARGEGGVTADWLEIDPGRVEPAVERIVVAASCDGGTFGEVADLYLRAVAAATGEQLALYSVEDATTETAILLGEFYRRDGGWKFRAVGQGYASGLPGLATDFGFTVPDEASAEPREEPAAAPTPAPMPDRLPPPPPLPEPATAAEPVRVPVPVPVPPPEPPQPQVVLKTADAVPVSDAPPRVPAGRLNSLPFEFGKEFPPIRESGLGPGIVEIGSRLPRGFVVVELMKAGAGYVNLALLKPNGRRTKQIMSSRIDDLHGRAVFRNLADRPLRLEVDTRCAWTVTLRPVTVVPELVDRVEGHGPDVLAHSHHLLDIKVRNLGKDEERGPMEVQAVRNNDNRERVFYRPDRGRGVATLPLSPRLLIIDAPGPWSIEPTELNPVSFWLRHR
ncbi:TerD family protein [Streptomyces sp. NBC_01264]|uniref:TerD family protein n=1 Tax=Streptomyces sp. NBC_01264 TaxID=2903804 RepID=UPI002255A605|nr:TerD family protein [Streptomyces sp. NBC_01264]MCX4778027.1 TerD family protein [Streptomyces sp. NBC_01264]